MCTAACTAFSTDSSHSMELTSLPEIRTTCSLGYTVSVVVGEVTVQVVLLVVVVIEVVVIVEEVILRVVVKEVVAVVIVHVVVVVVLVLVGTVLCSSVFSMSPPDKVETRTYPLKGCECDELFVNTHEDTCK